MFQEISKSATAEDQQREPYVAPQSIVERWLHDHRDAPGFRESFAATPGGAIPQIEISSWMQLPYVLRRLSEGPLKIVFPASSDDSSLMEQAAIKKFLRAQHRSSIEELLPLLAERISAAPSFAHLKLHPPGIIVSAQDWIAAHQLSGFTRRSLQTTDILSAPKSSGYALDQFKGRAAEALSEHISSGRPLVVAIPEGAQQAAIADALDQICLAKPEVEFARGSVNVWTPCAAGLGRELEEKLLGEFIEEQQLAAAHLAESSPLDPCELPELDSSELPDSRADIAAASTDEDPITLDSKNVFQDATTESDGTSEAPATDSSAATAATVLSNSFTSATPPDAELQPAESEATREAVPPLGAGSFVLPSYLLPLHQRLEFEVKETIRVTAELAQLAQHLERHRRTQEPISLEPSCYSRKMYLCSEGERTELHPKPGRAQGILKECAARSFEESARLLFEAFNHLEETRIESPLDNLSMQVEDLVVLPGKGHAIFFSDLEGAAPDLAELIDHYNLIERWERNEPIFLCILGDCVDRSNSGSLLIDFLLDLKVRRGFSRQIILVPGNHELSPDQNVEDIWTRTARSFVADIFNREYPPHQGESVDHKLRESLESLCPPSGLRFVSSLTEMDESTYKARWGLYVLYHSIFTLLPKCIVSPNGLYSAHAGFPICSPYSEIFQPELLSEPDPGKWISLLSSISDQRALHDLIWNDLTVDFGKEGEFVSWNDMRRHNVPSRPKFTRDDFARFCKATDVSLMIRGHQNRLQRKLEVVLPSEWFEMEALGLTRNTSPLEDSGWIVGNVVTVSHSSWGALLDLSIRQPSADNVQWIATVSSLGDSNRTDYRTLPHIPSNDEPDGSLSSEDDWISSLPDVSTV